MKDHAENSKIGSLLYVSRQKGRGGADDARAGNGALSNCR